MKRGPRSRVDLDRALEMREAGRTLKEIGDEFGVSRERIRQLVNSTVSWTRDCAFCDAPFSTQRTDRRFCSRLCSQRQWVRGGQCIDCDATVGRNSARCHECRMRKAERERTNRWTQIQRLWNEGLPLKEIALAVGLKNANTLGVTMARMKHAGWDLPPRRTGWRGHERHTGCPAPTDPPRNKTEARRRYANAVRNGTLSRPANCGRCGQRTFVDGHHHDLMGAPLEVEWLCRPCHMAEHHGEAVAA